MKNARKLLPAIAMLLISAVMMSTASFAWFSMNTQVSATGMQIEAKSDQTFLLISADKTTAEEIQAQAQLSVAITGQTAENYTVYPAKVKDTTSNSDDITFQYAVGKAYDDHEAKGNYVDVLPTNVSDYVVEYVYYITVADNAVPASDIVVKALTIEGNAAVNVAVATKTAYKNFTATLQDEDTTILSDGEITDETVLAVHVYVYINGDHQNVTTANAANLGNTKVSITFGVQGATA